MTKEELRKNWNELKEHLSELDEMEFAQHRDRIFTDIDNLLSELKGDGEGEKLPEKFSITEHLIAITQAGTRNDYTLEAEIIRIEVKLNELIDYLSHS